MLRVGRSEYPSERDYESCTQSIIVTTRQPQSESAAASDWVFITPLAMACLFFLNPDVSAEHVQCFTAV
jgi:hypothetical protein